MKIAILQPSYLPWLGYFDQMARPDVFVFLDDVQYTKRDWRNRNRIRNRRGWTWLTVPVIQKHRFHQSLKEARIDNTLNWRRKHLETLRHFYSRAPFFQTYFPFFESLYRRDWVHLLDLCYATTDYLRTALRIGTPIEYSSALHLRETKHEKILAICNRLGADHLLIGDKARHYLPGDVFSAQNIQVEYHEYRHPRYSQQFPGFVPFLSVVDVLFNLGGKSLEILSRYNRETPVIPG